MWNIVKTALLMGLLTGLFLAVGDVLGGRSGMVLALGFAALTNLGAWWFSDRIVLAMYRARKIEPAEDPDLHALVELLAARAGIPKPGVYLVPMTVPNAFATGRGPNHAAIAVTERIRDHLSLDELEAVLAHELGHVVHRDTLLSVLAATFAGAISILGSIARWGFILGTGDSRRRGEGLGMLAAALVAPFAAMLVQLAISRSRETAADEYAARLLGTGDALARALRRLDATAHAHPAEVPPATAHLFIVNPLGGGGALATLFRTHPATDVRVRRLEALTAELTSAASAAPAKQRIRG